MAVNRAKLRKLVREECDRRMKESPGLRAIPWRDECGIYRGIRFRPGPGAVEQYDRLYAIPAAPEPIMVFASELPARCKVNLFSMV